MPQTSYSIYHNRAIAGIDAGDNLVIEPAINAGGEATQVQTLTVAGGGAGDTILATINGVNTDTVTFDTDAATTAGLLATAIQGSGNAGAVVVSVAGAVITLTARNAGTTNAVTVTTTVTGAITGTVAETTAAANASAIVFGTGVFYDFTRGVDSRSERIAVRPPQAGDTINAFAGIARFRHSVENENVLREYETGDDTDMAIQPNDHLGVGKDGRMMVRVEGAINPNNAAQVRLVVATDGTPVGRFSTAGSEAAGGAVLDISSVARFKTLDIQDGYAELYIKSV